jgi:ribosomal protein S18 acetylase RimI-like enzyme
MTTAVTVRPLGAADLDAYKALRDKTLEAFPLAFTSDAPTERGKPAQAYLARLGPASADETGGHFTLGAWTQGDLIGAISCERESRIKVAHTAHIVGMMVGGAQQGRGVGRNLLDACIARARRTSGLELLTLSVTDGNTPAIRLYERLGFVRYGRLPRAICVAGAYHAKLHMVLDLTAPP